MSFYLGVAGLPFWNSAATCHENICGRVNGEIGSMRRKYAKVIIMVKIAQAYVCLSINYPCVAADKFEIRANHHVITLSPNLVIISKVYSTSIPRDDKTPHTLQDIIRSLSCRL